MSALIYIDVVWISVAFLLGYLAQNFRLPPLLGFLAAGFFLNAAGFTDGSIALEAMAELGVMLLLFTIGLKLNVKSLMKKEVWVSASVHTMISVVGFGGLIMLFSYAGLIYFTEVTVETALLIGFALSFSSTVFAVKSLEDQDEMSSFHGKIAIGILIMQDIFAVLFLTISKGKLPTVWALAIPPFLWLMRKLVFYLMNRLGHGELFTLMGFFAALVLGASSFDLVGLKADLGALVMGVLLGGHKRSEELSKTLMGYKDMFLIGFFFQIGMLSTPSWGLLGISGLLGAVLILKSILFFYLLTRFRIRGRSAFLVGVSLSTYSEFGLIVAGIGQKMGYLTAEWLVILALSLSLSFLLTAPVERYVHVIFDYFGAFFARFEREAHHIDDEPIDLGDAEVIIFGLGRIGLAAYNQMESEYGKGKVIGLDYDHDTLKGLKEAGKNVVWADATDIDFWKNIHCRKGKIILLAMSKHISNMNAAKELTIAKRDFIIASTARFTDEVEQLRNIGVHYIYHLYERAGTDFASFLIGKNNERDQGFLYAIPKE